MSDNMRKFLSDWLEWSKDPSAYTKGHDFSSVCGLCSSVGDWIDFEYREDGYDILVYDIEIPLKRELRELLNYEPYPFGGETLYNKNRENGSMNLNEIRVNWVKSQLRIDDETV